MHQMMRQWMVISVFMFVSTVVYADAVTDQIDAGREAYDSKNYKDAITELQFAITQIQQQADEENAILLPAPLDGWTAGEISNESAMMAMLGGGTSMSREYQRDDERLEIQIVANSPSIQFMLMAINNPMMIGADPATKPFKYKDVRGIKRVDANEVEVTLGLAGQVMIKLLGENLADEAVITDYLDTMNLGRIKDALL